MVMDPIHSLVDHSWHWLAGGRLERRLVRGTLLRLRKKGEGTVVILTSGKRG
jgi:hypothetical protein